MQPLDNNWILPGMCLNLPECCTDHSLIQTVKYKMICVCVVLHYRKKPVWNNGCLRGGINQTSQAWQPWAMLPTTSSPFPSPLIPPLHTKNSAQQGGAVSWCGKGRRCIFQRAACMDTHGHWTDRTLWWGLDIPQQQCNGAAALVCKQLAKCLLTSTSSSNEYSRLYLLGVGQSVRGLSSNFKFMCLSPSLIWT